MSKYHCPHGGQDGEHFNCGDHGYLCHACREDRADDRADRLTEALAMAGLLASMPEDSNRWIDRWEESVAICVKQAVAALRAERGAKPVPERARDLDAPSPYDPAGMADYLKRRQGDGGQG